MKKIVVLAFLIFCAAHFAAAQPAEGIPKTLLPLNLLRDIINEASGDLALQNEIAIAGVYRNRLPEEYARGYFEPEFIVKKLKEYGIADARIIDLPTRGPLTWDAEMGELWILKPYPRKIADLKEIPASLCSGSATTDVAAELVYVGPGNSDRFYEGKDVKDKIVLVNGSPGGAQRFAVEKYGALGIIAYAASHSEFDPDEVGWNSISASENMKKTFGFMVSSRQGNDLRDTLERGLKVEVRAIAKTQMVPYKDQMVEAVIKGAAYPEEELVFSAHLFEGVTKQGANDNISGCVSILETARLLRKLMDSGKIPPLKRTVRFLFVPEMSGTNAYLRMNPEISRRLFANINQDMVGEDVVKSRSVFELVQAPGSLPSCLNDVVRAFYEWVGTTQRKEGREAYLPIWSPTGSRDPFYYVIDPYSGGSDHVVFNESGGVPAVMLCVWPDMWYHTSGDTVDKSDATQFKRVAVIGAASAIVLAGGGPAEVERVILEVAMRACERLGQAKVKAASLLLAADKAKLRDVYKDAANFVNQAFLRQEDVLNSIRFFIRGDAGLESLLAGQVKTIDDMRIPADAELMRIYSARCAKEGLPPVRPQLTAEEIRLGKIIPVRTEKMKGYFDTQDFNAKVREGKDLPAFQVGRSDYIIRNFVDGRKSILEIRNAVAGESVNLSLKEVESCLRALEKFGYVTLKSR
jgi:aminopeptidase YwaD